MDVVTSRRPVGEAIRAALLTGEPRAKVMAAREVARDWRLGRLAFAFGDPMPDRPERPAALELLPPGRMPKRKKGGSQRNRIALWHSLAHIEFVAIDLALDMAGRFGAEMGEALVSDFLAVAGEEAMHFALIERHLVTMGSCYGALPAHDGLWQAAEDTAHDVAARLAIVPMVLEARGLDVTPATLERVRSQGMKAARASSSESLTTRSATLRSGPSILTNAREIAAKKPNPAGFRSFAGTFAGA
jgi:uncharacterized ferritin-like protein (DUF455 family)